MSDKYRERMLTVTEELRAQRVGRYTSAPPIYRLAWSLSLHVRPPLYQPFGVLALGMGFWFGASLGLLMWFVLVGPASVPLRAQWSAPSSRVRSSA